MTRPRTRPLSGRNAARGEADRRIADESKALLNVENDVTDVV